MNFDPDTFCAAAWFGLRNNNRGDYMICCSHRIKNTQFEGKTNYNIRTHSAKEWLNSDYMQYVREQLSKGNKIPECTKCWQEESLGFESLRQSNNKSITDNKGIENSYIPDYVTRKRDSMHDKLMLVEIKVSNFCNYKCVMCNPWESSQIYADWIKNQDKFYVQETLKSEPDLFSNIRSTFKQSITDEYIDSILAMKPGFISILGGEPLLDKNLLGKLSKIDQDTKAKTRLHFITNGSVDLDSTVQQLGDFENISFSVSVDGIGEVNEHIRRGSDWEQIEQNVLTTSANIEFLCTFGALNVHHVNEYEEWCKQHNIKYGFSIIYNPTYLSLSAVPDLKQIKVNNPAIQDLINKTRFSHEDYEKFKLFMQEQD